MNTGRVYHTSNLLNDGTVIVAGGTDNNGNLVSSSEIYNPTTQLWTLVGNMTVVRAQADSVVLLNGQVLETGGFYNPGGYGTNSANLYTIR
jgi:hypothetical protein